MAYAALAALPTEGPLPSDAGLTLTAVLRNLLQLPAGKGNGGAPGESAAAAVRRGERPTSAVLRLYDPNTDSGGLGRTVGVVSDS